MSYSGLDIVSSFDTSKRDYDASRSYSSSKTGDADRTSSQLVELGHDQLNGITTSQHQLGTEAEKTEVPTAEEGAPQEEDPTADIPIVIKDHIKYMSRAQIRAARYLQKKRIFEFFNFLLGHLLSATPSDPILFLDNLLERCIAYRDGAEDVEAPLLFTPEHIQIVYKAFDPMGIGSLSMAQYKTAMMTMGINDYNQEPSEGDSTEKVSQLTFATEAERCLTAMLKEMLQVHRPSSVTTLPQHLEHGDVTSVETPPEQEVTNQLLYDVAAPHVDTYDRTVHHTYDAVAEHGYT